jgi:antitoxin component YwqK of YwqJK toxin-antitoxin module
MKAREIITTFTLFLISNLVIGQIDSYFYGSHQNESYQIIKEDSTGIYFYVTDDSSKIVCLSKKMKYKLFDGNYKLLVEGEYRNYVDYFRRFGKWTEYYDNEKIKATGFYYEDNPVGLWQFYHSNGQLKEVYSISPLEFDSSISYCIAGSYQLFFENGQLKENGLYKIESGENQIVLEDVDTGAINHKIVIGLAGKKYGLWSYYKQNGELEKKEDFGE